MKIAYILFAFIAMCCSVSCIERADIDLPNQESLLVVYATLCPQDSFIRVQITQSEPLEFANSEDLPVLDLFNTEVLLTGPNGSKSLPLNPEQALFVQPADSFPIVAGASYSISVVSPGFPKASGQTVIPQSVNNPEVRIDSDYSTSSTSHYYVLNTEWNDLAGNPNFYLVWIKSGMYGYNDYWYVTDQELTGERFDLDFTLEGPMTYADDLHFEAEIMHCTEAFYHYHRTSRATTDFSNPFAEPAIIYSNITNGIGCFAGYNSVVTTTP